MQDLILTVNAGSSSVKVGLFAAGPPLAERARGQVEGLGAAPRLAISGAEGTARRPLPPETGHREAVAALVAEIGDAGGGGSVAAVGHRIVHGGPTHAGPVRLSPEVLEELAALTPFAPLHQPHNLAGVAGAAAAFPEAVQVGSFDTAFHRTQPRVHETYALPDRHYAAGIRRYGFHGLSYAFIARRLAEGWPALAAGRVVVAHLGNGASVAGLVGGRSQGSSMGFSPTDGLVMGTRSGQIDPGAVLHLMRAGGLDAAATERLLTREAGLLGLSGLSQDMRVLLASPDERAARAVHHFTSRAVREIAAMAGLIGGIDAVVFTAGIGERATAIRGRILEGLGWLGFDLDPEANRMGGPVVTRAGSARVALRLPTDEEAMIAREACGVCFGKPFLDE